ncbi:slipin family protein [Maribacter arcticus]|jgi:regulator of protease activity HflC (stomatin/prohibitin superfamily)|uniref:Regulator of protease activity HflC, stomatin/prohibitin superfamily n=1 Tax=Maribacter arcticus TaxID=561365 RepID=A0A1T5DRF9_9FLAO|nr:slipin family protein [Maribacter arcticus]SKB74397.1 Regulator of protease activity HflC, stomatin/prohibitin superfamily [Maribacter arcticus]|tara:strand:+ start:322 stop:1059 length:738 start_codon:yes stop_codon:yes gene_type:complete
MSKFVILGIVVGVFLFSGIRIIFEYKRAIKFRFGKYIKTLQPGLRWIIPIIETIQIVDIRVITFNIDSQEVMTEDNVPCSIDGVVFFKINDPEKAVLEVEQYKFAITQLSQAALRDVCGKVELDTILSKREEMGKNIKEIVEQETKDWGIIISDVKIKDIQLPENMRRMMANQAEAERSRRAQIILALAEEQAAGKLLEAGKLIDQSPSAIKLRLYQTLSNIAAEKNSTILFPFPEEMMPRKKEE